MPLLGYEPKCSVFEYVALMQMSCCSRRRGRSFKSSSSALAVLAFANKHSTINTSLLSLQKTTPFQSQSSDCTVHNKFAFTNYTDRDDKNNNTAGLMVHACYHKLYKSHSWLWAKQTQAIDSHCFHMQLLTTTFIFTIIHEDSTSENRQRPECQEALSEGQFGKQTHDTYFVWSWRSRTKRWYWSLHVLGTLPIFFPGHFLRQWNLTTVSSGSDGGSLWRLLCLLVHHKTQHL